MSEDKKPKKDGLVPGVKMIVRAMGRTAVDILRFVGDGCTWVLGTPESDKS